MAFKDLDAAILVGSMPRKEGMERKDLLKANVAIFKSQGAALEKYAKKTVKVVTTSSVETNGALRLLDPVNPDNIQLSRFIEKAKMSQC